MSGHHRRRRHGACIAVALALSVASCSGASTQRSDLTSNSQQCSLSSALVPNCGALWGITTERPTVESLATAEREAGRSFDFVYRFHDINDVIPDDAERQNVADGKILHLSIDPRDFSIQDRTTVPWADVARGKYDDSLTKQAAGIASLDVPVFVTFDHETNQPAKSALGTPAEFQRAWRHVHDLFEREGATKVVWVWVMLGGVEGLPRAGALWPGNDYVDWISWDVYNASGCRQHKIDPAKYVSFRDAMVVFYDWVHAQGSQFGIDATKPMMISETGSTRYPGDSQRTAEWYREIPDILRQYPQIKAVGLWDHTGNGACDYRITGDPTIAKELSRVGQDPWLNAIEPSRATR